MIVDLLLQSRNWYENPSEGAVLFDPNSVDCMQSNYT